MNVVITGANSNLGKELVLYYKKKNKVFALSRKKTKFKYNLEKKLKINFFKQNNIDLLIHLAHDYSKRGLFNNVSGSKRIFEHAKAEGVKKIIFISTLSSHKDADSNYGKIKFQIENIAIKRKILIIRPGLILGKYKDKKIELLKKIIYLFPVLPYFFRKDKFTYSVHISDLCKEIYKLSISKKYSKKIYNIFYNKKIFFKDILIFFEPKKKLVKLPFCFFYIFTTIINTIFRNKAFDSFLGILKPKQNYFSIREENIYTKKSII